MSNQNLPKFPKLLVYPTITGGIPLYQYTAKDLPTNSEYRKLVKLLFSHPEEIFYLYLEAGLPENGNIEDHLNRFGVEVEISEPYYYLVSGYNGFSHFMKISPEDFIDADEIKYGKLKEYQSKSKMYYRSTLRLSERKKVLLNNRNFWILLGVVVSILALLIGIFSLV